MPICYSIFIANERFSLKIWNKGLHMMAPQDTRHQNLASTFTITIGNYIRSKDRNFKVFPAPFAVFLNKEDQKQIQL